MSIQRAIFTGIFILLLGNLYGQSDTVQIKFLANAGFQLTDGKHSLIIDFPYKSGAYGYMEYSERAIDEIPENAILLFTHKHADHYSRKAVKSLSNPAYCTGNRKKLIKIEEAMPGLKIESFKTHHRFSLRHFSYLITWHGLKFYISGDTEHPETIASIKDIDYAFIPYWILLYTNEKNLSIDAQYKIIYHLASGQKFAEELPDSYIPFDNPGISISAVKE